MKPLYISAIFLIIIATSCNKTKQPVESMQSKFSTDSIPNQTVQKADTVEVELSQEDIWELRKKAGVYPIINGEIEELPDNIKRNIKKLLNFPEIKAIPYLEVQIETVFSEDGSKYSVSVGSDMVTHWNRWWRFYIYPDKITYDDLHGEERELTLAEWRRKIKRD